MAELPESRVVALIPAYQAAGRVEEVVRSVRDQGLDVIVVDDGSTDRTSDEAEAAGALVVRHPANLGKGEALATGFVVAFENGADAILTMDADGQHAPDDIPALLAAHQRAPTSLILGVRDLSQMPRRSQIGNGQSNFWVQMFMGRWRADDRLPDTQTGFRIYPASLLRRVRLRSQRFETETELLLWASKLEVEIVPIPIRTIYDDGHTTHFRNVTDALRVIRLVVSSPLWRVPRE